MKGKYTYELTLSIGCSGADRTDTVRVEDMGYERKEWDALSDEQRQDELNDFLAGWVDNYLEFSWE